MKKKQNIVTLKELLESQGQVEAIQLSTTQQIELLKGHKESVFTLHMEDGRTLVRGDSDYNQEEMKEFFERYPQKGCERIEFHK